MDDPQKTRKTYARNRVKLTGRSAMEMIAIAVITAVVLTLAVLQYQWTGKISQTEQERLKAALATSVRNFNQEFSYDFQQLCESFEADPEAPASTLDTRVLQQHDDWMKKTARAPLLGGLYIWRTAGTRGSSLESFNPAEGRFREVAWPPHLASLRGFLVQQVEEIPSPVSDREAVYYPWTVDEATPALVRPLFQMDAGRHEPGAEVRAVGFLVVDLNGDFLTRQYLPDLVERHFGTLGFAVSVRSAKPPYQTIYQSQLAPPAASGAPDATVNLFGSVGEEARRRGRPPLQPSDAARQWQLVVQHPAGSLEMFVAAQQRRNLTVSLGLLFILAGSMMFIFTAARRAERLARLQMEFVAGVSHELCTPLAVINSAAENLVDGVVDNPQQMQEYGEMIRDQGRRLERLVDEVLLFAAGKFGHHGNDLHPIEIAPIVTQSLTLSEPMLRDAGFAVEKEISAGLPLVVADPAAVSKCVENLVSNAVKYAGASRWVAVRARVDKTTPRTEVQISVEDKGIGIPAADLPNIFEPFYRVRAVRDGQIRGVGLGLYLVKRLMEGMGGRVSVASELGRGTFFTLHFPVAGSAEH